MCSMDDIETNLTFYHVSLQVHQAYQRQAALYGYLVSCHDLWEQADSLVARGSHTGMTENALKICFFKDVKFFADFFIELDHENGPITLHSSSNSVVKYVQAGIQKLRRLS